MLKLFYCPKTRAIRPMWLLEELGVPYEKVLVNLKEGAHISRLTARPAFQKVMQS